MHFFSSNQMLHFWVQNAIFVCIENHPVDRAMGSLE